MPLPSQDDILRALGGVEVPNTDDNIVHAGMVSAISIHGGEDGREPQIQLVIEVDPAMGEAIEVMRQNALAQVQRVTGAAHVSVIMTAHKDAPSAAVSKKAATQSASPPELPQGVKNVIAVASAKGGVGKSTTAVNLALALYASGLSVGILDADVHGPSIPRLMNLREEMEQNEAGLLIPHEAMGIAAMSIGLLVPEEAPVIWRGPMIHGALKQMLHQVDWGRRDVLILDMPPGTGDVPLSIAQHVPLTGAVIVSTPQDLALQDVRKGVAMFAKMGVPLMGMIENMSSFECPHCHGMTPIFGHGGAREDAHRMNIPFLGHMPLAMALREASDAGAPVVYADPEGTYAQLYKEMAGILRGKMGLT